MPECRSQLVQEELHHQRIVQVDVTSVSEGFELVTESSHRALALRQLEECILGEAYSVIDLHALGKEFLGSIPVGDILVQQFFVDPYLSTPKTRSCSFSLYYLGDLPGMLGAPAVATPTR